MLNNVQSSCGCSITDFALATWTEACLDKQVSFKVLLSTDSLQASSKIGWDACVTSKGEGSTKTDNLAEFRLKAAVNQNSPFYV